MARIVGVALASVALLHSATAEATYSVVAVDPQARRFGAAGASCVPYEVDRIHASVPGKGAFVAQANFDEPAFAAAIGLLEGGATAADVLAQVTDVRAFPDAPKMQYGVVDAAGGLVTWTGPEALPVAVDVSGEHLGARVGALGNVLTSDAVVAQALAGFRADACDLPERLLAALEAASLAGEGDKRCTPEGRPANSAFLDVTGDDAVILHISVPDVSPADPVHELRARFDAWRVEHPCPTPVPPEEGGGNQHAGGSTSDPGADGDADGCSVAAASTPARPRFQGPLVVALALAARLTCPRARPARRRRPAGSRT